MSIMKYIFVVCSVCEEENHAPGMSVKWARELAKMDGWKKINRSKEDERSYRQRI